MEQLKNTQKKELKITIIGIGSPGNRALELLHKNKNLENVNLVGFDFNVYEYDFKDNDKVKKIDAVIEKYEITIADIFDMCKPLHLYIEQIIELFSKAQFGDKLYFYEREYGFYSGKKKYWHLIKLKRGEQSICIIRRDYEKESQIEQKMANRNLFQRFICWLNKKVNN